MSRSERQTRYRKMVEKTEVKNEVGVTDAIGVDIIVQQVINLYEEQEAFRIGKDTAVKNKENYSIQWDIDRKLQELQLEHFGMADEGRTHKIHFVEEFWVLQKKKFEFEVRMEKAKAESELLGFDAEIKRADERAIIIKEQLEQKIVKLKELGAEIPVNPYVDNKED